jgi:hypothetical protein
VHSVGNRFGFVTVQSFLGVGAFRGVLIPTRTRICSVLKSVGGHSNGCVGQSHLHAVHYRDELALIVLVIGHERPQSLVDVSVHDFRLSVSLLVVGSRQFNLYANDSTELLPEG